VWGDGALRHHNRVLLEANQDRRFDQAHCAWLTSFNSRRNGTFHAIFWSIL
jgi:hypothetical protein